MADFHDLPTNRPIPWRRHAFTPIPKKVRRTIDENATIQSGVLCAYCKSLSEEINRKPNNTTELQGTPIPALQKNVFDNARGGCHLCTRILNTLYSSIYEDVLSSLQHQNWSYSEASNQAELTIVLQAPNMPAFTAPYEYSLASREVHTSLRVTDATKERSLTEQPLTVSTMSDEHIKLAATWLQQCYYKHDDCPHHKPAWMPSRLIEITSASNVKLIETKHLSAAVPYYALSYCWGTSPVLTTKKANIEEFGSIIPLPDLPLTIQDTITVVNRLGGRYLWVDSVCIIQDDEKDWSDEAATMCDVYQNAYLTIVALGAASATEGLFASRDSLAVSDCWLTADKVVLAPKTPQPSFGVFYASELQKRGWTFQERALARRKLFFSSYIYWECTSGFEEEVTNGGWHDNDPFNTKLVSLRAPVENSELMPDHHGQLIAPEYLALWYRALRDFTARQLTRPTDRLVAISGVIKFLERTIGKQNRYGMWLDFFPCDLLWKLPGWRYKAERLTGLPTWSWASLTATVAPAFDIMKALMSVKGTKLVSVQDATLVVQGRLLPVSYNNASHLYPRPSERQWRLKALIGVGHEKKVRALMDNGEVRREPRWSVVGMEGVIDCVCYPDFGPPHVIEEYFMIPMILQASKHFSKESPLVHIYGIGIKQSPSDPGCFERFGVFDVVFDSQPRRRDRVWTWKDKAGEPHWPRGDFQTIRLV